MRGSTSHRIRALIYARRRGANSPFWQGFRQQESVPRLEQVVRNWFSRDRQGAEKRKEGGWTTGDEEERTTKYAKYGEGEGRATSTPQQ